MYARQGYIRVNKLTCSSGFCFVVMTASGYSLGGMVRVVSVSQYSTLFEDTVSSSEVEYCNKSHSSWRKRINILVSTVVRMLAVKCLTRHDDLGIYCGVRT